MLIAGPGGFLLLSGAGVPAVNQPRGPRADRLFAVTASLLKLCTGLLTGGGAPGLLGNRQHCALVPVGAGTPLTQPAHQAGPLTTSLQAIIAVDRLVAVLPGVPVFDENLRHGPAAVAG